MRRVRLLVLAVVAAVMLVGAPASVSAQEWILSNSIPPIWMYCDWWWNPQNVITGQAQWEYWCYAPEYDMWTRTR